jgi:hypothetical protein
MNFDLWLGSTTTQQTVRKSLIIHSNSNLHLEDITPLRKFIEISLGLCLCSTITQYIFRKSLRFYTNSDLHLEDSEI